MKYLLVILCFEFLSCNSKNCYSIKEVFDEEDYKSITTMPDKFGKKATEIFVNVKDSNRILIKTYWENQNVQSVTFFRKKIKNGPMTIYDYDGKPQFEGFYINDKMNGTSLLYNNGKVSSINFYYRGVQREVDSSISNQLISIMNQ